MQSFAPWETAPHLAVAVSGGADSLALARLAHAWAQTNQGRITALMVDHGLRPEAVQELDEAEHTLAQHGIASVRLKLNLTSPTTQDTAREARYQALQHWCQEHAVLHLLLGHHADDQAETLLMRWLRGSGFDGMASMAACREAYGLRLLRPLLSVSKSDLYDYLRAHKINWAEDPSNHHPRYARSHLRALLRTLPGATQRLATCAQKFGLLRAQEETARLALMARYLILWPDGVGFMKPDALHHPDAATLLGHLLRSVDGSAHPPRSAKLAHAIASLRAGHKITLHHCVLEPNDRGVLCYHEHAPPAIRHLETRLDAPHITKTNDRQSLQPAKSLGNSAFFAMNRGDLTP